MTATANPPALDDLGIAWEGLTLREYAAARHAALYPPCPYTSAGIACTAGELRHKGPHAFPGIDARCWVYRRTVGVPPTRCTVTPDHHAGPCVFPEGR